MNTSFNTELNVKPIAMVYEITSLTGNIKVLAAQRYRDGDSRIVAHALKDYFEPAIQLAAERMRPIIASLDNVALVPMPSHFGYATYTFRLAKAIGIGTIYDVLRCEPRERLYDLKKRGVAISPDDLGFYAIGSIPEDMNIVFIDNVVATGTTAMAAYEVLGRGLAVPFAVDC